MTEPSVLLQRLERAMAMMDARSRAIFVAHRLDDLSYAQIADSFGLSVEAVERHIADAILHLDRELVAMERRGRG